MLTQKTAEPKCNKGNFTPPPMRFSFPPMNYEIKFLQLCFSRVASCHSNIENVAQSLEHFSLKHRRHIVER